MAEIDERAEIVADLRRYWPDDVEVSVAANLLDADLLEINELKKIIAGLIAPIASTTDRDADELLRKARAAIIGWKK